jgi:hypothetical protein
MVMPASKHSSTGILINKFIAILGFERANISHHAPTID